MKAKKMPVTVSMNAHLYGKVFTFVKQKVFQVADECTDNMFIFLFLWASIYFFLVHSSLTLFLFGGIFRHFVYPVSEY